MAEKLDTTGIRWTPPRTPFPPHETNKSSFIDHGVAGPIFGEAVPKAVGDQFHDVASAGGELEEGEVAASGPGLLGSA